MDNDNYKIYTKDVLNLIFSNQDIDQLIPYLSKDVKAMGLYTEDVLKYNDIINHIKKDSYIICLDLKGKELSSEDFSSYINNISLTNSHITFIIGGSLGLSNKLLSICDYKICFSKMTFPHQLIRVFLLEQIYRGFKIINNETYHK